MKVIDRHEFFTQRVHLSISRPRSERSLLLDFGFVAKQLGIREPIRDVVIFSGVFVRSKNVYIQDQQVEVTFYQLYNRLTLINPMVWFGDDESCHSFSFYISSRDLHSADDSNHTVTQISYPQHATPPEQKYETYVFYTDDEVKFRLIFRVLPISVNGIRNMINERCAARECGDYERADSIRLKLRTLGVVLTDEPSGTSWERSYSHTVN